MLPIVVVMPWVAAIVASSILSSPVPVRQELQAQRDLIRI